MENIENSESNIQRWRIINVWVDSLPEEWKNILCKCGIWENDYSDRDVYEIDRNKDPEEFSEYPGISSLLQRLKYKGDNYWILIARKTPERQRKINRTSEIMCILYNGVKEYNWGEKVNGLVEKYWEELISILGDNYSWVIQNYLDDAKRYRQWEVADSFIEIAKLQMKQWASSASANDAINFLDWTKEEIEMYKNKFLENWSNIYMVS